MNELLVRRLPDLALLVYAVAVTLGAFTGGLWAGLGIGFALIAFFSVGLIDRKPPLPDKNFAFMALAFLLAAAALNFHSSQPGVSWQTWVRLVTIFVPLGLLFSPAIPPRVAHPKLFTALPIAIAAGSLALALELFLNGPLLHAVRGWGPTIYLANYNRGVSYLMLMAFPAMAGLWFSKNRWMMTVAFFLLLLIPMSLAESRTAKLALMLAMPVIVLAHLWPVLTRRALSLTPFLVLGWPFAATRFFRDHYDWLAHMPPSWHARMEIWDYMSYRIIERPLLGWGLGTSHTLPFAEPHGALYVFTTIPAAHPHNVVLQLWVELGLPGVALGIVFALLTLHKASRLDPRVAPFAIGAWVASFCLSLLAYDFWTDSLFAAFALTGFAFLLLEQKLKPSRSSVDAPADH